MSNKKYRYNFKLLILGMGGGLVFATFFLIITPLISKNLDFYLKLKPLLPQAYIFLGLVMIIPGGVLALWCVALFFIEGYGTPNPLVPPIRLITQGPYRYVRNPMVIGFWLILCGFAILLNSKSYFLFVLLLATPSGLLFIRLYEEKELEKRFGEEYRKYKNQVPRFIPKLGRLK